MYGAEIWKWTAQPQFKPIHNKYLREALGEETHTPIYEMLEETKWWKISTTAEERQLNNTKKKLAPRKITTVGK